MKRVCTVCGQVAEHGTAWCQTPTCSSGSLTTILDPGEMIGDIEVLRLLRIYRASALYEARRNKEMLLLKIAHDGAQEQLRNEARALAKIAEGEGHPALPILLPPYPFEDISRRPHGKTAFHEEMKYYLLMAHVKGIFLRDALLKNPQPWFQHAGWIAGALAEAVGQLHVAAGKLHLNISPDYVLIRYDKDNLPRPVLVDFGAAADPSAIPANWAKQWAIPAYTPPELLRGGTVDAKADIYGLGLILYEMLAGHPAFPFINTNDEDVRAAVTDMNPKPLDRSDLTEDLTKFVQDAIQKNPTARPQDARTFAGEMLAKFGEIPEEKKGFRLITRRQFAIGATSAILIIVLIVLGVVLQSSHILGF